MGLFDAIRPKAMNSDELSKLIMSTFGGGATSSGQSLNSEPAMRAIAVHSCVKIKADSFAQLPCHLFRKEGRKKIKAEDHAIYSLLADQPNEWMTAPEFWGMCVNHLSLRGNFFALKNRGLSLTGPVRELIPLAPGTVQDVKQNEDYSLTYTLRYPDGTTTDVPQSQIMHVRGMVINGYMGVNPIQYIRESIALGLASEEFGARYFGSGTHPGIIVEHPGKLSLEGKRNLEDSLTEVYSGLGESHRLMLLQEGMKYQRVVIDPKDSQFIELRKYQKAEIVDIFFSMPLTILSSEDKTPTFASAEQFGINYVVYSLMPIIVSIEKAILRDLVPDDKKRTHYAKFNARGLQRGSFAEQMQSFAIGIDKEIFSPNEVRLMLDENPYPGGDEYRTRTSSMKDDAKPEPEEDSKE